MTAALRQLRLAALALIAAASAPAAFAGAPSYNVAITQTGGGNIPVGALAPFTLQPANNGPSAINTGQVVVTSTVPPALTPMQASGPWWNCTISGQQVACAYVGGTVGVQQFPSITIQTKGAQAGPYNQCVNIQLTIPGVSDTVPGNNGFCVGGTVIAATSLPRDLTLSQTGGGTVNWGAQLTFVLNPGNLGPGAMGLGGSSVVNVMHAGLTQISANGPNWSCLVQGQVVNCNYAGPPLPPGPLPPITVKAVATASGGFTNCAVNQGAGVADPNTGNNQACIPYVVRQRPR